MTICYVDESGTDTTLPVAVVAGLLCDSAGSFWLDVEWDKMLRRYGLPELHMREFRAKDLATGTPKELFADATRIIRMHKLLTVGATLDASQYRTCFKGITKLSMYGACFCNLITVMGWGLDTHGRHRWPLSFLLDEGNPYRQDICDSKPVFALNFPRIATIDFSSDKIARPLQAADVLSWTVRRKLSGDVFPAGYEPLTDLFDEQHSNFNYDEAQMRGVAKKIQEAEAKTSATAEIKTGP